MAHGGLSCWRRRRGAAWAHRARSLLVGAFRSWVEARSATARPRRRDAETQAHLMPGRVLSLATVSCTPQRRFVDMFVDTNLKNPRSELSRRCDLAAGDYLGLGLQAAVSGSKLRKCGAQPHRPPSQTSCQMAKCTVGDLNAVDPFQWSSFKRAAAASTAHPQN